MTTTQHRDLNLNFLIHPVKKDIIPRIDENAVVFAVRNLLLTNHYERPFRPELGCNIRKQLFEPISKFTASNIQRMIVETIENFEPRVAISQVNVIPLEEESAYQVELEFFLVTNKKSFTVNLLLERIR